MIYLQLRQCSKSEPITTMIDPSSISWLRVPVKSIRLGLSLATLALCIDPSLHAQTWETLFTLALPTSVQGTAILPDPFSNELSPRRIFIGAAGDSIAGTPGGLLVLDRAAGSYAFSSDFSGAHSVPSLRFDPFSRGLYAMCEDGQGWQVRKTSDAGASWVLMDAFALAPGKPAIPGGSAMDEQGNIYVSGIAWNSSGSDWIIRKGTNLGHDWSTVDDLPGGLANDMLFVAGAQGGLFAVGWLAGPGRNYSMIVRRSRDAGATWTTVLNYPQSGSIGADAIGSDGKGNILVAGYGQPYGVWSSKDGGDSWEIIHTNPTGAIVRNMAVDPAGNMYVVGHLNGWYVQRRDPQGVWQEVEQPFGAAEDGMYSSGSANAIAVDRAGNVFVAGSNRAIDSLDPYMLVVQQFLLTPMPLPTLKVTRSGDTLLISWPASVSDAVMETTDTLSPMASWVPIAAAPVIIDNEQAITVDIEGGMKFYRLRKP